MTTTDLEALAEATRLARKLAATVADQLPVGEWRKVEATLLPDPAGDIEIEGVRYRQSGPTRVLDPGAERGEATDTA